MRRMDMLLPGLLLGLLLGACGGVGSRRPLPPRSRLPGPSVTARGRRFP